MKSFFVMVFLTLLVFFTLGPSVSADNAEPKNLLGISKLSSLDLDAPIADIAPFGEWIGQSRIVALGEANHTNGSFHMAMARLTKYLVEANGFRVILVETPRLPAQILNQYIHDCSKNAEPIEALNNIFPQFASVELGKLYFWIRKFNCSHLEDQVAFEGFDIQQGWNYSKPTSFDTVVLENFVNSEVFSLKPRVEELYKCGPHPKNSSVRRPRNEDELNQCLRFIADLEPFIQKAGLEKSELESSAIALKSSATQTLALIQNNSLIGNTARDAGMAEMTKHLLLGEYQNKKAVIIAHEGHVARHFQEFSRFTKKNMGTFLAETFGPDYFVAGVISFKPAKSAWWSDGDALPDFPKESTEGILFDSGLGNLILNTHRNSIFKPTDTLEPGMPEQAAMRRFVDAFVFVPTSLAMTNIPGVTTYPK